MRIHLLGIGLHIDANLLWHFDAVWLLDQPEQGWSTLRNDYDRRPRDKNRLHLALLPRLEVALLRGDVLHQLTGLVSANLGLGFFSTDLN